MASEKSEKQSNDRTKALDTALAQIERQFGKGSVMKMGDRGPQVVEVIPTGSIALDIALGIGGLPRGRIVEIYGPESSGKTTVALHAIQMHNVKVASQHLSTRNTRWIQSMPANSVLISTRSLSHSQILVSKRSKSWIC